MKLTDEDLRDFQRIWKSAFQEELPLEKARVIAADVMKLYSLLGQSGNRDQQLETLK